MRQDRRTALASLAGFAALAMGGASVLAQPKPRVIKVSARRFTYTPNVIELKRGEPVTLELTTEDVFMGFNVPDFNVRADIVPGKTNAAHVHPRQDRHLHLPLRRLLRRRPRDDVGKVRRHLRQL